jgi:signal recognition particle receptor subunit beta
VSVINFHTKEIAVKVVYYGPGLCGKTTSLQTIYGSLPPERRPQIVSLATEVDRTIFFDFLPVTAYRIRDFRVRLQLYTVPGQVFYNATRKLVLNGVDGIVFVADSQVAMRDSNLESLHNLDENLADLGLELDQVPTIIQFNKRDLTDIYSVEEMDQIYNPRRLPVFATVAVTGEGLFDALRAISQMVVNNLLRKGLGKQLGPAPGTESKGAPSPGAAGLSESIAAAAAASQTVPGRTAPEPGKPQEVGLWPRGDSSVHSDKIDAALAAARWVDAVLAVDAFLKHIAGLWAASTGQSVPDPVPSFLLMRGLSATRYRALLETVTAVRTGRDIDRVQAMNAVVVALEAVW